MEIIIVGVLIATFSSLAIFAIREQFEANKNKAAIGEARQIATALEFANIDTGIFPKLSFLTESDEGLRFLSAELGAPAGEQDFAPIFGFINIYPRGQFQPGEAVRTGRRAAQNWRGPYFAVSASRRGFAQGRGGYAYMLFPDLPSTGPNSPGSSRGLRYPTDPNNNPYVVYMLDIDADTGILSFVNEPGKTDVTRKGNYVNAVVSYGRNQYPGGQPVPADDNPVNRDAMMNLRLYEEATGVDKGLPTFVYRNANGFTRQRANIWAAEFANRAGTPLPIRPGGVTSPTGISDPNSDDIVYEF